MSWPNISAFIAMHQAGAVFEFPKTAVCHPVDAGAVASVGWPVGQTADYRFPPTATCSGVHVQDFGSVWRVHRDAVHPACDVAEHLRRDAAPAWMLGGALAGVAIGAIASKKPGAVLAGALLGALVAAALLPAAPAPG
jgi:hypothetical protein